MAKNKYFYLLVKKILVTANNLLLNLVYKMRLFLNLLFCNLSCTRFMAYCGQYFRWGTTLNICQYCDAVTDLGLTKAVVWGGCQDSSYCLPTTCFRVRVKSGAGSASRELDPEEMFRINVFLLILDRISTELDKMSNVSKKCPSQIWIWLN